MALLVPLRSAVSAGRDSWSAFDLLQIGSLGLSANVMSLSLALPLAMIYALSFPQV